MRSVATIVQAAVGIAVALIRYHRGPLSRQATLSAALVGAMGGGGDCRFPDDTDEAGAAFSSSTTPAGDGREAGGWGGGGGGGTGQSDASGKGGAPTSNGEGKLSGEGEGSSPEGSDPIVRDPWFQLVLCRECMLHGFYEAAEAGLRRLRRAGGAGPLGAAAVPTSDAVWVWTEVLGRVSAGRRFLAARLTR